MARHVREEILSLGIAFLESAVEDATRFMAEASPDNKYQKNMAYWFTLLTLIMAEGVSPDLRELKVIRSPTCSRMVLMRLSCIIERI
jgi:hypothetical protein